MERKRDKAVRLIIAAQVVLLVVGIALFIGAILIIQNERQASARDTCYLFRTVVLSASDAQGQDKAGKAFLLKNGLGDCVSYGNRVAPGFLP